MSLACESIGQQPGHRIEHPVPTDNPIRRKALWDQRHSRVTQLWRRDQRDPIVAMLHSNGKLLDGVFSRHRCKMTREERAPAARKTA